MGKKENLQALEERMITDASLPLRDANLVFGEGDPATEVMFIGEAPGYYEDMQKRPFVGRSGQLLERTIEGVGWKREDVYITNIVKRRPPNNRDPLPEEITAYKPYLTDQIRIINPKVIVPLGRFSMIYFLPDGKISRDQGKIFWLKDKIILPMYHPAAALRSSGVLGEFEKSFKKLVVVVNRYNELVATRHEQVNQKEAEVESEPDVQQLI